MAFAAGIDNHALLFGHQKIKRTHMQQIDQQL
jgi:hypothetical protein